MKTTRSLGPVLLALAVAASAGCSRDDEVPAAPAQGAAIADEPVAREQVGDLMRGEGVRPAGGAGVDARPLAGQAEMGVQALLGAPDACEDVAKGPKCRYARGATEIVFIDGMADWITVADMAGAPFSPAALARVGLPTDVAPVESTPEMMRWQNLGGFREVTLHAAPGGMAGRIELKMMAL